MLRARIDIKGLQKFKRELQKLEKGAEREELIRECLIEIAKRMIAEVKRKTPVATGGLRDAWQIDAIRQVGSLYEVIVENKAEYASFIEYGFESHFVPGYWVGNMFVYDKNAKTGMYVGEPGKKKLGRFMLKVSTQQIQEEMPRIIEHRMKKFLESRLK